MLVMNLLSFNELKMLKAAIGSYNKVYVNSGDKDEATASKKKVWYVSESN
jgi:hypothetical protein